MKLDGQTYAILRWDGNSWHTLDGALNEGSVLAFAATDSMLYVGGEYSIEAEKRSVNVAGWDGEAWSSLDGGVGSGVSLTGTSRVESLVAFDNKICAGGGFNRAGRIYAVNVQNVACWDGGVWVTLGDGLSSPVKDLASNGKNLYAGGVFREVVVDSVEVQMNGIARWDGERWHNLGSGLSDHPFTLAANRDYVYVGGYFHFAGGKPAFHFARWSTEETSGTAVDRPEGPTFRLDAAYPNPFSSSTTIRYRLDRPSRVRFIVYDVLGRIVSVPFEGWHSAGDHDVVFATDELAAGTYILHITAGGQQASTTLVRIGE